MAQQLAKDYEEPKKFSEAIELDYKRIDDEYNKLYKVMSDKEGVKYDYPTVFKETAVILNTAKNISMDREEKLASIDNDSYINASYIKSALKEDTGIMIATKGPQNGYYDKTVESFWKMVLQNNVTRILAVCYRIGDGGYEAS